MMRAALGSGLTVFGGLHDIVSQADVCTSEEVHVGTCRTNRAEYTCIHVCSYESSSISKICPI